MRYHCIVILFIMPIFSVLAQEENIKFSSYVDNANEANELCAAFKGQNFTTEKEANEALELIVSTIGASKNFILRSCENIDNAMAISLKGIRYIYYNQDFMKEITSRTNYWSNMSILAHEVGHHINGHTIDVILAINEIVEEESLAASRKMELEADEFSGFVLARLGATLEEASQAISMVSSDEDDYYSTHPSKSKRLTAIKKGYDNALGYVKSKNETVIAKEDDDTLDDSDQKINIIEDLGAREISISIYDKEDLLQSNKPLYWIDIYDSNEKPTGKTYYFSPGTQSSDVTGIIKIIAETNDIIKITRCKNNNWRSCYIWGETIIKSDDLSFRMSNQ